MLSAYINPVPILIKKPLNFFKGFYFEEYFNLPKLD